MVERSQHYIHNPQAFLDAKAYEHCVSEQKKLLLAQLVSSGVASAVSIFSCKASDEKNAESTPEVKTPAPAAVDAPAAEEDESVLIESDDDIKKNILEYLKDTGITPDDTTMDAIVKKYKNIKEFAKANGQEISENKLKERIILFTKGLEYRKATNSNTTFEIAGVQDAITAGNQQQYNQAYKNHAAAVIELYDENGDGALNRTEFIASQLAEAGETPTDDNMAGTEVIFSVLDQNNDGKIDSIEMGALQRTIAKRWDNETSGSGSETGNDITAAEYQTVQLDLTTIALSALTSDESAEILNLLNSGRRAEALVKITNNANLSEDEKKPIKDFIELYYKGLSDLGANSN